MESLISQVGLILHNINNLRR